MYLIQKSSLLLKLEAEWKQTNVMALPGSHVVTAEVHFIVEIVQPFSGIVFKPVYHQLTTTF